MAIFRELIPEHIPNGYNINKTMLVPVNNELKKLPKKGIVSYLVAMAATAVLSIFFSKGVGGFAGNMIATFIWILFPLFGSVFLKIASSGINKSILSLGLSNEASLTALKNRSADKRAWGEMVKMPIYYRFTCKKCKKQTDWYSFPLISCTNETLQGKLTDFQYRTNVKRKYYENKRGWAKYSLEHTCPFCNKKQKKNPPKIILIVIAALIAVLPPLINYIVILGEYHKDLKNNVVSAERAREIYKESMSQTFGGGIWEWFVFMAIVIVVLIVIYIVKRKKYINLKPEYYYCDNNQNQQII
ncbi:MAG: hypothetical protein IJT72_03590 [Lachnospiraceae bacterium]|nr:hypothetical protein [Lachnospiraceae bacterium]